jgi:hypothetical protein
LNSCNDFLDTFPQDQISEGNFWHSENDVTKFVANIYATSFIAGERNDTGCPFWDETMSDNSHMFWTWYGGQRQVATGIYDAYAEVPVKTWTRCYANVRKCWQVLDNIDRVVSMPQDKKDQYSGETHFLLAYNYYYLTLHFGDVPLVSRVLTADESKELTRTSKAEIVQFIVSELNEASSLLNGKETDKGRITWGACQALKARMLLFDGQWDEAVNVTGGLLGKYSLNTAGETPYEDLFSGAAEDSPEIILSTVRAETAGGLKTGHYVNQALFLKWMSGGDAFCGMMPTGSLVDSYPMADGRLIGENGSAYDPNDPYKNRDPRFYQSIIYPTGQLKYWDMETASVQKTLYDPENAETPALTQYSAPYPSATGYVWNKYADYSSHAMNDITDCTNDIIWLRYAEVLLIRAEALAEVNGAGSRDEICDLLDQLRTRCGGGLIHRENYNAKEALIDLVRNERRVELAGEGLRTWDIRRWRIAEKSNVQTGYGMEGDIYGAAMRLDGVGKENRTVTVNGVPRRYVDTYSFDASKHYLFPIPQSEIDLNPNLKQNPGW